jgi:rod shape-determining protein MreB
MIIDIGGGTTDIAILSLGGIVTSSSIKVAGNTFDTDIMKYIKNKYKLLIGDMTAETIKLQIGNVFPDKKNSKEMSVRGRDLVSGLPNTITLSSIEIEEALRDSSMVIVHTAKSVLEQTPPELAADIVDRGITLTGGGALIKGLDKLLEHELKVPVTIAETPLACVALGAGNMLDNINLIDNM